MRIGLGLIMINLGDIVTINNGINLQGKSSAGRKFKAISDPVVKGDYTCIGLAYAETGDIAYIDFNVNNLTKV